MFQRFCTGVPRAELREYFDLLAGYCRGLTSGNKIESPHKLLGDTYRRAPRATLALASHELRWDHFKACVQTRPMLVRLGDHFFFFWKRAV